LNAICKSYERNRKQKKKREKTKIKIKLGLREPLRPSTEKQPAAQQETEPVRCLSTPLADVRDPPARPSSSPRLPPSLETAGQNYFPLQSPLIPALIDPSTVPIRPPRRPPPSPFSPPAWDAFKRTQLLVGDRNICGPVRPISTLPVSPRPPLHPYQPPHSLAHLLIHRNRSISQ
jgi:hypothetical protein